MVDYLAHPAGAPNMAVCYGVNSVPRAVNLLAALTVAIGITVSCAWFSQADGPADLTTGLRMTSAAKSFLQSLDEGQKPAALMAFDSPERTRWHFIPLQDTDRKPTRKGLRLEKMNEKQRELAIQLLKSGTSERGFAEATQIMSLEAVLNEMEKGQGNVRSPLWYFVSIFGEPGSSEGWGWRFEGHHLTMNFTLVGDKVTATTPCVFCANPAVVRSGKRVGLASLPGSLNKAQILAGSLTADQLSQAQIKSLMPEIDQAQIKAPGQPESGVSWTTLNSDQKQMLNDLLREYTGRLPKDLEAGTWRRVLESQDETLRFAFALDDEKPGKPMTYRVSGKGVLVQFLNVQADGEGIPANHYHTALRQPAGDFQSRP
ncbi:MAG: DUF3500 domain-containing protein [Planctomycetota bacterium]|nr:DUF3500 domain-containing protein [Planctomycetota bacterium]